MNTIAALASTLLLISIIGAILFLSRVKSKIIHAGEGAVDGAIDEMKKLYIQDLYRVTKTYRWVGMTLVVILAGTTVVFIAAALGVLSTEKFALAIAGEGTLGFIITRVFSQVNHYEKLLSDVILSNKE